MFAPMRFPHACLLWLTCDQVSDSLPLYFWILTESQNVIDFIRFSCGKEDFFWQECPEKGQNNIRVDIRGE